MTLRTDLAAKEETVLEESGIVLDPVRNRVPEDLKTKPDMKLLLNDLINEAYRYFFHCNKSMIYQLWTIFIVFMILWTIIYDFSDFSKAMMNLISDQTEEDVENDFRKFRP